MNSFDLPVPGGIYRHKRTGNQYLVEGTLPIKLNEEWIEHGVTIYVDDKMCHSYARLTPEFLESFEFVEES